MLRRDGYQVGKEDEKEFLRVNEDFRPFGIYNFAKISIADNRPMNDFVHTRIVLTPQKKGKTGNCV